MGRRSDLPLDGRDVAERADVLFLGLGRRLQIGRGEAFGPAARETFQLRFRLPELFAKDLDALVVAGRLLVRSDALRCAGLRMHHQAGEDKHKKPGRTSTFTGCLPALNIDCLHGAQCPPLPIRVSTMFFDSGVAKSGAAIFREGQRCRAVRSRAARQMRRCVRDSPRSMFQRQLATLRPWV